MSRDREELLRLVVEARRWAEHLGVMGMVAEPAEAPLPPADPSIELAEPEVPEPVLAPAPDRTAAWASIAEGARAAAQPAWAEPTPETLDQVRADLGDCRRCKLCEKRTQIVFGVGDPDADLMVIGEGPGEQEDLRGEPFVGPAGQMLDRMLENVIGLKRSQVYIANVVKCRPPGNRNPQVDEIAACQPFLDAQIAAVRPRIIVTLGKPAANLVLRNDAPISSLRGRFHEHRGVRVMPTFHPAYLLREPDRKRDTWNDLKQVIAELERIGVTPSRPPRG